MNACVICFTILKSIFFSVFGTIPIIFLKLFKEIWLYEYIK